MPNYPITGMRSHRHPFLGAEPTSEVDKVFKEGNNKIDYMKYVSPVVSGGISFLMVYGAARAAKVEKSKAVNVGVFMGVITIVGQFLGSWMWDKLQEVKEQTNV